MNKENPLHKFENIVHVNQELLEHAREERWADFNQLIERYIICLNGFVETSSAMLTCEEKETLNLTLQALLRNENEMTERLRNRLDFLKRKMTALNQGTKCNQAYAAQLTSSFH